MTDVKQMLNAEFEYHQRQTERLLKEMGRMNSGWKSLFNGRQFNKANLKSEFHIEQMYRISDLIKNA